MPGVAKEESPLEAELAFQIRTLKLRQPLRDYRFAAKYVGLGGGLRGRLMRAGLRDWRFDFAWPLQRLAVECEGGARQNGRHTRPDGFAGDLCKYHAGVEQGWLIYRCDMGLIKSGKAVQLIAALLERADN